MTPESPPFPAEDCTGALLPGTAYRTDDLTCIPSPPPQWWQDLDAEDFRWSVPECFNIAAACLDDKPDESLAIMERGGSRNLDITFGMLRTSARAIAHWLLDGRARPGDRIAVFLPQCWELPAIHLAAYYAGLIVVPLTTKFGASAVRFRLEHSQAVALFGRPADLTRVGDGIDGVESLANVVAVEPAPSQQPHDRASYALADTTLAQVLVEGGAAERHSDAPELGNTRADDPALLIYTSGTTGNPKGALHAHHTLIGHMPGVRLTHDAFPQPGDLIWTPAEWAWIGGILDVLLPALACGVPVVASDAKVSPELCALMLGRIGVRNAFIPPTALKQMRSAGVVPDSPQIRTLASGGEALGQELQAWAVEHLGAPINEFYGQTEMNMTVGQWRQRWHPPAGSMGRAVPGFTVAVLDPLGEPLAPTAGGGDADGGADGDGAAAPAGLSEVGEIAVHTPNPGEFLGYWNEPQKTAQKYSGPWLLTGDLARIDGQGNLHFEGRADDVISSAGYRIGPGEIEESLLTHPAVSLAAVVGEPDELRGERVVAHIVLADGAEASDALAAELQEHVKHRLAFYQYPRAIYFRDELPMTTTGKILRRELKG